MADLTGKTPADTFKSLVQFPTDADGVTAVLQTIEDGKGVATILQLSTTAVNIAGLLSLGGNLDAQSNDIINLANLFLNNNSIINWGSGDFTLTHNPPNQMTLAGGTLNIDGNFTVSGNTVIFGGALTSINSTTLSIRDSLVRLANNNNSSDVIDIGLIGLYGVSDLFAGLFRDASDGKFRLFKDSQEDLSTASTINIAAAGYTVATLVANLEGGTVSGLSAAIAITDGGTGSITASGARINLGLIIGTDVQAFSSVLQATTASFLIADETKLDGIEVAATANSADAFLLDRTNHTGTQLLSTISDSGALAALSTVGTTEIDNSAVTLAKMADVATGTVFYRKTAGSGSPETQTLATLKTDLDLTGTNSGDQTITLTGDVTGSGTGTFVATISADVVTNAKLANVATATIKGRVTAATGDPEDLTGTQATTLLDVFTSALKGLVPASGGGTTNFLRADGTFAAPPGGGSSKFKTTDQTITAAGALTLAHGLGAVPDNVVTVLKNTTAEFGYSIGDLAIIDIVQSSSANQGAGITPTSTDIEIRFGAGTGGGNSVFKVIDKTTGLSSNSTNANWDVLFIAVIY